MPVANGQGPVPPGQTPAHEPPAQDATAPETARSGMTEALDELARRREAAEAMGGEQALARHRASGRMPVRERVAALVDPGTWFEIGALAVPEIRREKHVPGDAVVTGFGTLDGRRVGVIGIDASRRRRHHGADQHAQAGPADRARPARRLPARAALRRRRRPDARRHGLAVLRSPARLHHASSAPPTAAGGAAGRGGPRPVLRRLGAARLHRPLRRHDPRRRPWRCPARRWSSPRSASASPTTSSAGPRPRRPPATPTSSSTPRPTRSTRSPRSCPTCPRTPRSRRRRRRPVAPARDPAELADVVPHRRPRGLRHARGVRRRRRRGVRAALGRRVGAEPAVRAGPHRGPAGRDRRATSRSCARARSTRTALAKEHDFVDLCDTFGLPLVFLHDVPGLMIGSQAERGRHPARLRARGLAHRRASVPQVGVVLRKAYGGGHFAMGGRPTGPDFLFAWPTAEMGFMAPETGIRTVHRRAGWTGSSPSRARRPATRGPPSSPPSGSPSPSRGRPRRTCRWTT